jgi:protein-L-isoaspartate(D-aspartate) O-methyltransferase
MAEFMELCERMVVGQLQARGIRDSRVLEAMRRVPRHRFVRPGDEYAAYEDRALTIGAGQTISQPYMVATMTEALGIGPASHVLEIGTGSGYQAAVLAEIARDVVTIEVKPDLAEAAEQRFVELGYTNIKLVVADGSLGYPEGSPYDGIIVTAAAPRVPESLKAQLSEGGRLVVPVGTRFQQEVVVVQRQGDSYLERAQDPCVFVPLVGKEGWDLQP